MIIENIKNERNKYSFSFYQQQKKKIYIYSIYKKIFSFIRKKNSNMLKRILKIKRAKANNTNNRKMHDLLALLRDLMQMHIKWQNYKYTII
jgi:hypothetical protein